MLRAAADQGCAIVWQLRRALAVGTRTPAGCPSTSSRSSRQPSAC